MVTVNTYLRDEGLAHPVHAFYVQVKREIPIFLFCVQDRAVEDETGNNK